MFEVRMIFTFIDSAISLYITYSEWESGVEYGCWGKPKWGDQA